MFTDEFLDKLPDDPAFALHKLCEAFQAYDGQIEANSEVNSYFEYLEAFATFQAFSESFGIEFDYPDLDGGRKDNVTTIRTFIGGLHDDFEQKVAMLTIQKTKSRLFLQLNKSFRYEFSEGDLNRVQSLISELRENIVNNELFDDSHRQRLLKRLENLQVELHKKVADLDRFWGLVGDAGVVLGKFGEDAKPLVDRIKEIAKITWRTQARAEELPSDAPVPRIGD